MSLCSNSHTAIPLVGCKTIEFAFYSIQTSMIYLFIFLAILSHNPCTEGDVSHHELLKQQRQMTGHPCKTEAAITEYLFVTCV